MEVGLYITYLSSGDQGTLRILGSPSTDIQPDGIKQPPLFTSNSPHETLTSTKHTPTTHARSLRSLFSITASLVLSNGMYCIRHLAYTSTVWSMYISIHRVLSLCIHCYLPKPPQQELFTVSSSESFLCALIISPLFQNCENVMFLYWKRSLFAHTVQCGGRRIKGP